jgi:hypothetical protein
LAGEKNAGNAEQCDTFARALTPIYYAPSTAAAALAGAHGRTPSYKGEIGLTFELKGQEPCNESSCLLLVFDEGGKRLIASIDVTRRNAKFCRVVEMIDPDPFSRSPCDKTEIHITNYVYMDRKGNDESDRVDLYIEYEYFIDKKKSPRDVHHNDAAGCVDFAELDIPSASNIFAWQVTDNNGAVTTIHEVVRRDRSSGQSNHRPTEPITSVHHANP